MSYNLSFLQDDNERLETDNQSALAELFVQMPEKNGVVVIRLLPPAPPSLFGHSNVFFQKTRLHYLDNRSYHCPKELKKVNNKFRWVGDCVICDHYNWLWEESKKPDCPADKAKKLQDEAREIKPVERNYWNCIVRKEIDPKTNEIHENVGPKIFSVGVKLHRFILRAIFGDKELEEDGLGDVFDPIKGRDLKIIRTMTKGGDGGYYPSYDQSKFLDVSPLGTPDQIDKWLSELHDLTKLRNVQSKEELEKQMRRYLGGEVDDDSESSYDPRKFGYNGGDSGSDDRATVTTIPDESHTPTVEDVSKTSESSVMAEENVVDTSAALAEDEFMRDLADL